MKVLGDYVAINRVIEGEKVDRPSSSGFEYSGSDKNDMRIYTGKIVDFSESGKMAGLKKDQTVYYDKSRAFIIRLSTGDEYTMIKLQSIVAVE
jgi:hypothetical protein